MITTLPLSCYKNILLTLLRTFRRFSAILFTISKRNTFLKLLFLLVFLGFTTQSFGQYHYKGQRAIELSWGKSDIGYLFKGGYSKYLRDNLYYKGLLVYEFGRPFQTSYHNYEIQASGSYSFFNINEDAFFNFVGGATANYEYILDVSLASISSINYGFILGCEGEYFINSRWAFIAGAYQHLLINRKFGNERWDFSLGLKITLP